MKSKAFTLCLIFLSIGLYSHAQTFHDIDGNIYHAVTIGNQIWMTSNLKTTKYNDGTAIPNLIKNKDWKNLEEGYCWFSNNEKKYKEPYGAIYKWKTVDSKKLCPTGWHVPDTAEWNILINYLGGREIAGENLKEVGLSHWKTYNFPGKIQSGFNATPSGMRNSDGTFDSKSRGVNLIGKWWCSTEGKDNNAYIVGLYDWTAMVGSGLAIDQNYGFSVRCIKDSLP